MGKRGRRPAGGRGAAGHGHHHDHGAHSEAQRDEIKEEERHYLAVRLAFLEYADYSVPDVERLQRHLSKMPPQHAHLVNFRAASRRISSLQRGIQKNQEFLNAVIFGQDEVSPFPIPREQTLRYRSAARTGPRGSAAAAELQVTTSASNQSKMRSTLHLVARDWSSEGAAERRQCLDPILDELEKRLPIHDGNRNRVKVLVPGAGAGRLVVEISARGYACQGNEFAYFCLFLSNFVLNGGAEAGPRGDGRRAVTSSSGGGSGGGSGSSENGGAAPAVSAASAEEEAPGASEKISGASEDISGAAAAAASPAAAAAMDIAGEGGADGDADAAISGSDGYDQPLGVETWVICPYVDAVCNNYGVDDPGREVLVPDVSPSALLSAVAHKLPPGEQPDLSFTAGEWLEVYSRDVEDWDCIATCFFLDTAPVVTEYITAVYRMLRPGGVWINLGPLLYHWASAGAGERDERFLRSLELTFEEVRSAVLAAGFEIAAEKRRECTYCCNQRSMVRTVYNCVQFTAIKPLGSGDGSGGVAGDGKVKSSSEGSRSNGEGGAGGECGCGGPDGHSHSHHGGGHG